MEWPETIEWRAAKALLNWEFVVRLSSAVWVFSELGFGLVEGERP